MCIQDLIPPLQGVRRPPLPARLSVKRALAAHEAGKGLVATLLRQRTGFLERIERVSMVPRGRCAADCTGVLSVCWNGLWALPTDRVHGRQVDAPQIRFSSLPCNSKSMAAMTSLCLKHE